MTKKTKKCKGSGLCENGVLPTEFASEEEMEAFWDSHRMDQFLAAKSGEGSWRPAAGGREAGADPTDDAAKLEGADSGGGQIARGLATRH